MDRPNRFIAHVDIGGCREAVHVKNTGRCRELLIPGARVLLTHSFDTKRKTAFDLVAVYKEGAGLINIDSQAPNRVAYEWLSLQDFDLIRPEYVYGESRIDFYMERRGEKFLMEVKGCTLEVDGVGFFPDAPSDRAVKHLRELVKALKEGYRAVICFVIPMEGVTEVRPCEAIHPEFARAFKEAIEAGVKVINLPCRVYEDGFEVTEDMKGKIL